MTNDPYGIGTALTVFGVISGLAGAAIVGVIWLVTYLLC